MLASLRNDPATLSLPVIIASAAWHRSAAVLLPRGGPIRFSRKPFDIVALTALLDELLAPAAAVQRQAAD